MTTRTQVLLSWSGGKDAAWTLHTLRQREDIQVVALLTTINAELQRIAMHGIRRNVLHAQAAATGLPLIEVGIPPRCDNATYDTAMSDALARAQARWPRLRTAVFGDLYLEDVRAYRERNCARIGWKVLTPLFGADTTQLAHTMIDGGLHAQLCCVDTQQLDAGFCGSEFDGKLLAELPDGVDPCGENGEFHTCVTAGPMFAKSIALTRGETVLRDARFAFTDYAIDANAAVMSSASSTLPLGGGSGVSTIRGDHARSAAA